MLVGPSAALVVEQQAMIPCLGGFTIHLPPKAPALGVDRSKIAVKHKNDRRKT